MNEPRDLTQPRFFASRLRSDPIQPARDVKGESVSYGQDKEHDR